jgi:hypothetical protein
LVPSCAEKVGMADEPVSGFRREQLVSSPVMFSAVLQEDRWPPGPA